MITIVHKSIHIIDYDAQQAISRDAPVTFDDYVSELINHIDSNTSVREYKTLSNSTEVIGCILGICNNQGDGKIVFDKMNTMARRLLIKETEAQKKIHRMKTTVQKGSLVQALLYDDEIGKHEYLLAKVEHTEWVDDADFTFKTGFSKDKKTMWKSCLFDLSDINANEFHAKVYSDTKAQYWSDGFLELCEMNSDESNTQRAFQAIDAALGHGFKGITRPDHIIIRNYFIGYFKNNAYIDYPVMVNSILENYQPDDIGLTPDEVQKMSKKIQSIRINLLEQPEKKNFDSQFNAVSSVINAKIRKVYPVNDGIDLKVTRNITDLPSTIQSIEENGIRYIKIRTNNDATYRSFQFKSPSE